MHTFDRITWNAAEEDGEPRFRGTQLTVRQVVELAAEHRNAAELFRIQPELRPEDVSQAIAFSGMFSQLCRRKHLLRPCEWTLAESFPVIPHALVGTECHGCLQPQVEGDRVRIVCNVCGFAAGDIHSGVLLELVNMISGRASQRYLELITRGGLRLPG